MAKSLPNLSRFELQCLRMFWEMEEATVRDIHDDLGDAPSYSTVRKIVERLEDKGAVERVRRDGTAWVYRSAVAPTPVIRREIRRFLDGLFNGAAGPLVAHLAEMEALSVEDLREIERAAADAADGLEDEGGAGRGDAAEKDGPDGAGAAGKATS